MNQLNLPEPPTNSNFDSIDPIDSRYYDAELAKYLSERSRIYYQAYVESALAQTLVEYGICSQEIADEISNACQNIDAEHVAENEKVTKHDVKALVNTIKEQISDQAKPFVHFGATSYDIVATALSLQLRDATNKVVIPRLIALEKTLISLTNKYANTVQIGRTHGQHAVPITFGFALAEYVSRLGENIFALNELSSGLTGKFSGAVGAYNALGVFVEDPQAFEKAVLSKLEIDPAPYSNQIIPAESYVRLLDEMAISSGIMANLANDIRHLQRSEIAELRESFGPNQTGSSTMAHKRNPITFENVVSLNKQVSAQIISANANLSSEHQRDLTDSASARYYGLVLALVATMAKRLQGAMEKIEVDEQNMQRNLHLSQGAIAAEPLYLLLEKYGHTTAHEVAKSLSHQALDQNKSLFEIASQDQSITEYFAKFSDQEKQILQSPEKNYSGKAAAKARQIAEDWYKLLS